MSNGDCRQELRVFVRMYKAKGGGANMLRRSLQIVALCCGAFGLALPAQAQFRFSTEALFMDRDNNGSQSLLNGPDSISSGGNTGFGNGYRFTFGGSYGDYDVEFIGAQLENWDYSSAGTLVNPLIFDETANNPIVVVAPPANTLAFQNSLFDAATAVGVEDLESERLQAGATFFSKGSSRLEDYQINFGNNPSQSNWRFGLGWRQMRLNESNNVGITGTFDALDTDDAAVAGDATDEPNNMLSDGAITGAGYSLRSGSADGYDAADVLPGGPDTLQLYYASGTNNILNGVQASGGYRLFPERLINVDLTGRVGMYHNYAQGNVGEYLIGSVNDDSIYQRRFNASHNGVAFGGSLGAKASLPVTDYISLTAGYESMLVTNVALAPAQLGGLSNTPFGERQYRVRAGDRLILHGVTVGMLVTW